MLMQAAVVVYNIVRKGTVMGGDMKHFWMGIGLTLISMQSPCYFSDLSVSASEEDAGTTKAAEDEQLFRQLAYELWINDNVMMKEPFDNEAVKRPLVHIKDDLGVIDRLHPIIDMLKARNYKGASGRLRTLERGDQGLELSVQPPFFNYTRHACRNMIALLYQYDGNQTRALQLLKLSARAGSVWGVLLYSFSNTTSPDYVAVAGGWVGFFHRFEAWLEENEYEKRYASGSCLETLRRIVQALSDAHFVPRSSPECARPLAAALAVVALGTGITASALCCTVS